jgi:hypothetical protein
LLTAYCATNGYTFSKVIRGVRPIS